MPTSSLGAYGYFCNPVLHNRHSGINIAIMADFKATLVIQTNGGAGKTTGQWTGNRGNRK